MSDHYRLEYIETARNDLQDVFDYIKEDDPEVAAKFIEKIDKKIRNLESFPLIGTLPNSMSLKSKGFRILIVDNYLVLYKVVEKIVEIHRVIHGRRQFEIML